MWSTFYSIISTFILGENLRFSRAIRGFSSVLFLSSESRRARRGPRFLPEVSAPLGVEWDCPTTLSGVIIRFGLELIPGAVFWIMWSSTLRLLMASDLRFVPNTVLVDACGDKIGSLLFVGKVPVSSGSWKFLTPDCFTTSFLLAVFCKSTVCSIFWEGKGERFAVKFSFLLIEKFPANSMFRSAAALMSSLGRLLDNY